MTETTINVRSSRTRVRCPYHWPQAALLVGVVIVEEPPTTEIFGMPCKPFATTLRWVLADGCQVQASEFVLVTKDANWSYFEYRKPRAKEETMVDTRQLSELRSTLQKAREQRDLDQKIDAAGVIVETLDNLVSGSIIRFDKPFAEDRNLPSGTYTYVAIKPGNGKWYMTGAESGPMSSDDMAAFMLAGQPVTEYQLLAEAEQTYSVTLGDTPAAPVA